MMASNFIEKTITKNLIRDSGWVPNYTMRGYDYITYGDDYGGPVYDTVIKRHMSELIQCRGVDGSAGPVYDELTYRFDPIKRVKRKNEDRIVPVEKDEVDKLLFGGDA